MPTTDYLDTSKQFTEGHLSLKFESSQKDDPVRVGRTGSPSCLGDNLLIGPHLPFLPVSPDRCAEEVLVNGWGRGHGGVSSLTREVSLDGSLVACRPGQAES